MTDLTDRIAAVLDLHYGGWIDNGKPDECRCPCGYRPSLGESHGAHVAAAVVEELGLRQERHIVAWLLAELQWKYERHEHRVFGGDVTGEPQELY